MANTIGITPAISPFRIGFAGSFESDELKAALTPKDQGDTEPFELFFKLFFFWDQLAVLEQLRVLGRMYDRIAGAAGPKA